MIIVLVGCSCSGKTFLLNTLVNKYNLEKVVTYTSRKPRKGEIDGIDYNFVTNEFFKNNKDDFLEIVCHNSETDGLIYYGTHKDSIAKEKNQIIIVDSKGLMHLKMYCATKEILCRSFYIDAKQKIILGRLKARYNTSVITDEIKERLNRDLNTIVPARDECNFILNNNNLKDLQGNCEEILAHLDDRVPDFNEFIETLIENFEDDCKVCNELFKGFTKEEYNYINSILEPLKDRFTPLYLEWESCINPADGREFISNYIYMDNEMATLENNFDNKILIRYENINGEYKLM